MVQDDVEIGETSETVDWVVVWHGSRKIGAVGFVGNEASVITAFYDDNDVDQNGKVTVLEWVKGWLPPSRKGFALTQVAMEASRNEDIIGRDPTVRDWANKLFLNFSAHMVADAFCRVYLSPCVGGAVGPIAGRIAESMVVQYAIKKGAEAAVNKAVMSTFPHATGDGRTLSRR
jgi:hypothetical protein